MLKKSFENTMSQQTVSGEATLRLHRSDPARKGTVPFSSGSSPVAAQDITAAANATRRQRSEASALALLRQARFALVHELPGRMRLRPWGFRPETRAVESALRNLAHSLAGADIALSPRTGSLLIHYDGQEARGRILRLFDLKTLQPALPAPKGKRLVFPAPAAASGEPAFALRVATATDAARARQFGDAEPEARNPVPFKTISFFFPRLVNVAIAILRALPYLFTGLKALLRGRLDLEVLDASALLVCILRRDFRSLSSIVFFFALGEYLADWTKKKSRASLAESLALNIDQVWVRAGDLERQVPLAEVEVGDVVVVRAGTVLPVDGTVLDGDGMINQSSMTGEAMPAHRTKGATVYAGTVLEEGELAITASGVGGNTRVTSILRTIEESESVKASIQGKYERVADAIVPYNFLLSGAVYAATRDPLRAGSVLLVDYSCAIRLATPLAIFTAMREAAEHGVLIKGGKFMEALAEADVVVFDKTGTLTEARPVVAKVVPFGEHSRACVLRLAACLEEHFVHPVGQAVVRAAEAEGLKHREEHTQVEFIVAHGIASRWRDQRVIIGSDHFVLEDEGIPITSEQQAVVETESARGRSVLYLAIGEALAGLLLIEDSIREETRTVVEALRQDGVKRVIMLTGDGELTAASIAARAGIGQYRARLLPEAKAAFVASLKKRGHKVMMVGDGINDSPALSASHVGVAMAEGADMAREVADVVLVNGRLEGLLLARRLSRLALSRVRSNFHTSLLWNSLFLAGGLLGLLRPGLSALLHNATTAAIAVNSVRPFLPVLHEPPELSSADGKA